MSFPNQWLQHPWFIHLGWALVHFLWQGTLVALLLAAVLRAMRKQSAEVRYAAACAAMVLMAALPVFTLAALVHHADSSTASILERAADLPAARGGGLAVPADHWPAHRYQATAARIVTLANQSLPLLVVVWAIGAMLLLARLVGGCVGVARARREAAPISNWVIRSRLIALSLRMGIPRTVQLLESAYVTGPAVIGVLKPAVIFPIAALTGLWPIQVEAILAHELAHIRRHDYLVNLVQSVVETLLFYHPAVWWVSTRVRQEREHCCDDMAVRACGNNVFYATALADLDDLRMPAMELAVAATGAALLPRIRRLIMPPPNRASNGGIWAGGALAGVLLLAALAAGIAGSGSVAQGNAAVAMRSPTLEPIPTLSGGPTEHGLSAVRLYAATVQESHNEPDEYLTEALPPVATPVIAPAVEARSSNIGASSRPTIDATVVPDDQPAELAANLPEMKALAPTDAVQGAAELTNRTIVARREFHRSGGDPAVAIPMSIPAEIVAFVRRDSGYWPLGATAIRATPNGGRHVIVSGKTNNQSSAERGWTVRATEKADPPADDRMHLVGSVRLSIEPGREYSIPFDVEMRTQPDPRQSGQLATTEASVTWFAPTTHRLNVPAAPPQPVVQFEPPDLMLRPIPASWDASASSVFGTVTPDNSPALKSMTRAGLAAPPAGAAQGLVRRNAQPLIGDSSKSEQKN
jgi:beta-lactamase regulating signal transducer with metallopeptidase domain